MAKKKSKSKSQKTAKLSPNQYIREKARALPIDKCYITPDWKESGISQIIISRLRPGGNLVVGIFLVDTFCIGIKDVTYQANMPRQDFEDLIERYKSNPGLEEITYNEAHNIIYGSIAFAEEGGIKPAKDFKIAQYILEDDTDDIPLIEYDFGKDGKHFLIINSDKREMPYLHQLKKTLGNNFEYLMEEDYDIMEEDNDIFDNFTAKDLERGLSNWEKMMEESDRHPKEVYSYNYPEYPKSLSVKNQFIADELMSHDNSYDLPRTVIERILALPHDEAADDISNIVMFEIGRSYDAINDNTIGDVENGAIMHAILLLTQLRSENGLNAVLEIMRQNGEFADYHLGDLAPEVLHQALYACGLDKVSEIESYIYQPGLDSYLKQQAFDALAMIAFLHPERRNEIIEVFRRLLKSWINRLPQQEACDGSLAGFLMCTLLDLEAKELSREIKDVFETDCVDKSIAGDCNSVLDELQKGSKLIDRENYKFPDIYQQYEYLKSFFE